MTGKAAGMAVGKPAEAQTRNVVERMDVAQFDRLGAAWWDEDGAMAPLHKLNPARIGFIRDVIVRQFGKSVGGGRPGGALPFSGLTILDIGCGGGLLSEPLTRLGGRVTGIDPGPGNIAAARSHAEAVGLTIDYRATPVEALVENGERFDVVVASEVVEHVADQQRFIAAACSLVRPDGLFIASTLNRTAKAFLLAIVGAEYVLGWLPRGTHDWDRFVKPDDLARWIAQAGLRPRPPSGIVYNPLRDRWSLGRDTDVNYILAAGGLSATAR